MATKSAGSKENPPPDLTLEQKREKRQLKADVTSQKEMLKDFTKQLTSGVNPTPEQLQKLKEVNGIIQAALAGSSKTPASK